VFQGRSDVRQLSGSAVFVHAIDTDYLCGLVRCRRAIKGPMVEDANAGFFASQAPFSDDDQGEGEDNAEFLDAQHMDEDANAFCFAGSVFQSSG